MKAYRDYYRKSRGITEPEIILPVSAHAAFLKACDYFCMKPVFVDLDENYIAGIEKVKSAITKNTVAIVGSMPNFPYGTFDPVSRMDLLLFWYPDEPIRSMTAQAATMGYPGLPSTACSPHLRQIFIYTTVYNH